tara:strand:+ start:476 stop:1780 length:1305 start_codon:yes stop_codon:yes gene_type:complete
MTFILRGRILTFKDLPQSATDSSAYLYLEDGALIIAEKKIVALDEFNKITGKGIQLPVIDHRPNLILPGFIDLHNHFPQLQIIGSFGTQLMDWLQNYTFPEESKFSNTAYAKKTAKEFVDTLLNHGTTTTVSFGSVHAESVEALFSEANARNMCLICGKVMMDRNAPRTVLDTVQSSYDQSKALIGNWHERNRLKYAISPRFAITSSPGQLEVAGSLARENPSCLIQTHLSESNEEIELTMSLFPDHKNYLDIYARYGLTGRRSLFGHAIHLTEYEQSHMLETQSVAVHCPTSNLFLGSGLFDLKNLTRQGIRTGIATDTGGGTSFSMLKTLDEAYKIQQLQNYSLSPLSSFYWATLGNAKAIGLENEIGTLAIGSFADLIVLDSRSTSLSELRMRSCDSLFEELFVLQTLGDDRAIKEVYIAGKKIKELNGFR